jgi:hypothetical protein
MSVQTFHVSVVRPSDLLDLRFEFINVDFTPPQAGQPGKITGIPNSYLAVYFQPQHIAEEAFFETSPGAGQTQEEQDAGQPPLPANDEFPSQPGAVQSIISGPSRLVFTIPANQVIEYTLAGLLAALTQLPQNVSPLTTYGPNTGCSPLDLLLRLLRIPPPPHVTFPTQNQTAIEAPYRLILSPDSFARWDHVADPVIHDQRTELWHTRLGTRHSDGRSPIRAIWSPDFIANDLQDHVPAPTNSYPFRMTLDTRDRNELVHLTANYYISGFIPEPVDNERLMLTTLGAWLKLFGEWDPPDTPITPPNVPQTEQQLLTVEQWRHEATMARDHYVRVMYAGYLAWVGHRASLVKVTERKFYFQHDADPPGVVAYLFQRMFIIPRERVKTYNDRDMPFKSIRIVTPVTPNLNDPNQSDVANLGQSAFWPQINVNGQPTDFLFHLVGTDWENRQIEFIAPLLFVDKSKDFSHAQVIRDHFNTGLQPTNPRRQRPMNGQTIAFAPAQKANDTSLESSSVIFTVKESAQPNDTPHFRPKMTEAKVDIPAVKQLLGKTAVSTIAWEDTYLTGSGSSIGNKGDVFAKVTDSPALQFAADQAGGMVAPDINISGLSRSLGPVGGPVNNIVGGNFNPKDIFAALDVKLLGGIALSEIIRPLLFNNPANVGDKLPKFVSVRDGNVIRTSYVWKLTRSELVDNHKLFLPKSNAEFSLEAVVETSLDGSPPTFKITGKLTNFGVLLLPEPDEAQLVQIDFNSVIFTAEKDKKVDTAVDLLGVQFKGILQFVNTLSSVIPLDGFNDPPSLEISTSPPGVNVGFSFGIPTVGIGIMTIQNISLAAGFFLPFGKDPLNFHFAFCTRQQPFILTVSLFGGGFFAMDMGIHKVVMIEAALEFGASVAINLGVASGQATIMAGFYFQKAGDDFTLTGYFRAGGSLSVLGIITVSLEFYLALTYETSKAKKHGGTLWGQASLTVKIEILFFSTSVSISMEREFSGSDPNFRQLVSPDAWALYADAFADYPA